MAIYATIKNNDTSTTIGLTFRDWADYDHYKYMALPDNYTIMGAKEQT